MPRLPYSASAQPHFGCGLSFPLQIDARGNLQLSAGEQSVEESMSLILGTQLGERVYRPTFGSRLAELAFAPLNTQTLLSIRLHVEEALTAWEPRIQLEAVRTEPDPVRGRVDIVIDYRLRANHVPGSLVYPFYLQAAIASLETGREREGYARRVLGAVGTRRASCAPIASRSRSELTYGS